MPTDSLQNRGLIEGSGYCEAYKIPVFVIVDVVIFVSQQFGLQSDHDDPYGILTFISGKVLTPMKLICEWHFHC